MVLTGSFVLLISLYAFLARADSSSIKALKACFQSGEDIQVTFYNENPHDDDFVGIYSSAISVNPLPQPESDNWVWTCGTQACLNSVIVLTNRTITFQNTLTSGTWKVVLGQANSKGSYSVLAQSEVFLVSSTCAMERSATVTNGNSGSAIGQAVSLAAVGQAINKALGGLAPTSTWRPAVNRAQTPQPTIHPTPKPTTFPALKPLVLPTPKPVKPPTHKPVKPPTQKPIKPPTQRPIKPPTRKPVKPPTRKPIKPPTLKPTKPPTHMPTKPPTPKPSKPPTPKPTNSPTLKPTNHPIPKPTPRPTLTPTRPPTQKPTTPPPLSTDKTSYTAGEVIKVTFHNASPQPQDWIGIFSASTPSSNLGQGALWAWTCGSQSCGSSVSAIHEYCRTVGL